MLALRNKVFLLLLLLPLLFLSSCSNESHNVTIESPILYINNNESRKFTTVGTISVADVTFESKSELSLSINDFELFIDFDDCVEENNTCAVPIQLNCTGYSVCKDLKFTIAPKEIKISFIK